MNRFQIGFGKWLSVPVRQFSDLILPVDNILGCNLRQFSLGEIRQDLLFDDALLCKPGIELQLWFDILLIQLDEALKGHIDVRLFLHQELTFPGKSLLLGGKPTLEFLLPLTFPVGIAKLYIPGTVVLVLKRCHNCSLLSVFLSSCTVELLVEELAVNPPGNCDAPGFCQFLVQLANQLVGVGYRYAQFLGHFVNAHKNLVCHGKYLPFSVVRDCGLRLLRSIHASLLMAITLSRLYPGIGQSILCAIISKLLCLVSL